MNKFNNEFKGCILEIKQLRDVMDIQMMDKPYQQIAKFKKKKFIKY